MRPMEASDIYFWEPTLSPHKSSLISALAENGRIKSVSYISQSPLTQERESQGWTCGLSIPPENIIIAPSDAQTREIMQDSHPSSLHVFSGIHWVPCIVQGLQAAIRHRRRFCIMSEPRDGDGWKGMLRLGHSWLTERPIRKHADFILAIGRHGPEWFARAGYPKDRIFPFAYFTDPSEAAQPLDTGHSRRDAPVIGYIGRRTAGKGFCLFQEALSCIHYPAHVIVAGKGDPVAPQGRPFLSIEDRGVVPMPAIRALMRALDVLVVPSLTKNDGWAMVISEALLEGTAVIASPHVGASICLEHPDNGRIVSPLSGRAIAQAIQDMRDTGGFTPEKRAARQKWATARLTAGAGAAYMLAIKDYRDGRGPCPPPFYASP